MRAALAAAEERDAVVIYADAEGEWVEIPPYSERKAVVCGYFSAVSASAGEGIAVITTGAAAAL